MHHAKPLAETKRAGGRHINTSTERSKCSLNRFNSNISNECDCLQIYATLHYARETRISSLLQNPTRSLLTSSQRMSFDNHNNFSELLMERSRVVDHASKADTFGSAENVEEDSKAAFYHTGRRAEDLLEQTYRAATVMQDGKL